MYYFYIYADVNGKITEFDICCAENSALKALGLFAIYNYGFIVYDVRRHPITDKDYLDSLQRDLERTRAKRAAKGWPC